MVHLSLHFSGGLELLFDKHKELEADVPVPSSGKLTIRQLLPWMRDHLLTERPELFMKDDSVRPGVLVLVNDVDWELSGLLESQLSEEDVVTFISTLHGG